MIDTVNTKAAHYVDGGYTVGSGDRVIVVLGSCRIFPFVNYLDRWNRSQSPEPFTIFAIYVVNFTTDVHGSPTDCEAHIDRMADNPVLSKMVTNCSWFIHEHTENYGYFNTSKDAEKNIYQVGMYPEHDIAIPNFNDHFILENDYSACGIQCPNDYINRGETEIEKFCHVCWMSSFPEFADVFKNTWRDIRYFWRPNHVSKEFTLMIFRLMNEKYLRLPLPDEFWSEANKEDLFRDPHTEVTDNDRKGYGLKW